MKQRKLSIESKVVVQTEQNKKLLHPTDLHSALEIARTIAIWNGIECKVVETTGQKHTVMIVNGQGEVKTIRSTIANIAKKLDIPCKFGKTWKAIEKENV